MWTKGDEVHWNALMEWEQQLVSNQRDEASGIEAQVNKLTAALPDDAASRLFGQLDQSAAWICSFLQKEPVLEGTKTRIMETARLFQEDIESIEQMRSLSIDQLHFICQQQSDKIRAAAAVQGALTGTGKALPILADLLAVTMLQIRTIQTTALSYGVDLRQPFEMEHTLHLLYTSLLPASLQANGWAKLITEVEEKVSYIDEESWGLNESMLQKPLIHAIKLASVRLLQPRKSSIPLLSMAVSAGVNYQTIKQTAILAEHYYQYRYLHDKKNRP